MPSAPSPPSVEPYAVSDRLAALRSRWSRPPASTARSASPCPRPCRRRRDGDRRRPAAVVLPRPDPGCGARCTGLRARESEPPAAAGQRGDAGVGGAGGRAARPARHHARPRSRVEQALNALADRQVHQVTGPPPARPANLAVLLVAAPDTTVLLTLAAAQNTELLGLATDLRAQSDGDRHRGPEPGRGVQRERVGGRPGGLDADQEVSTVDFDPRIPPPAGSRWCSRWPTRRRHSRRLRPRAGGATADPGLHPVSPPGGAACACRRRSNRGRGDGAWAALQRTACRSGRASALGAEELPRSPGDTAARPGGRRSARPPGWSSPAPTAAGPPCWSCRRRRGRRGLRRPVRRPARPRSRRPCRRVAPGRVTTGMVKLVALTGAAGVASAMRYRNVVDAALGTVLVAGGANLVNLFDLRPGSRREGHHVAAARAEPVAEAAKPVRSPRSRPGPRWRRCRPTSGSGRCSATAARAPSAHCSGGRPAVSRIAAAASDAGRGRRRAHRGQRAGQLQRGHRPAAGAARARSARPAGAVSTPTVTARPASGTGPPSGIARAAVLIAAVTVAARLAGFARVHRVRPDRRPELPG